MSDGIYMNIGIFFASAKSDTDACSTVGLLGEQVMAPADEDNEEHPHQQVEEPCSRASSR